MFNSFFALSLHCSEVSIYICSCSVVCLQKFVFFWKPASRLEGMSCPRSRRKRLHVVICGEIEVCVCGDHSPMGLSTLWTMQTVFVCRSVPRPHPLFGIHSLLSHTHTETGAPKHLFSFTSFSQDIGLITATDFLPAPSSTNGPSCVFVSRHGGRLHSMCAQFPCNTSLVYFHAL